MVSVDVTFEVRCSRPETVSEAMHHRLIHSLESRHYRVARWDYGATLGTLIIRIVDADVNRLLRDYRESFGFTVDDEMTMYLLNKVTTSPYDGVLLTTMSETLVAKALEEFFDLHDEEPCWTTEALHYMKLEQEELNDPPEAHILYSEVKAYLMARDLWTPP